MPKVEYNGKKFDSELEVEYYKYLHDLMDKDIVIKFEYHPKHPININKKSTYTPDFIVEYDDKIVVVETKGYNPYSKLRDDMIHQYMLGLTKDDLKQYLEFNGWKTENKDCLYSKIKYLKAYGFVDWDFKNPNTIANKRKEKINELNTELKELKQYKKDCLRYFSYLGKLRDNKKLTKSQEQWFSDFEKDNIPNNLIVLDIKE